MTYTITNRKWNWNGYLYDEIGVLISVDKPTLYKKISQDWEIPNIKIDKETITLQKHGIKEIVKANYLFCVDSPLRQFCTFHYLEIKPTQINADNLNWIIERSCLPRQYLDKLIEEKDLDFPKSSINS